MKLYGSYTSPFVRHCRVAVLQAGFDFEFIEADYAASAAQSPTSKVPYLAADDMLLTDSSTIIKYVREKAGHSFLAELDDYENFTLVNTAMDSVINLFLLENDGIGPAQVKYLSRQNNRVASILATLDERFAQEQSISRDGALRCACFIDWALFRRRIDIDAYGHLQGLLAAARAVEVFADTAPPR